MKNSDDVLRHKEIELARLRQEVAALNLIIPLLVTEGEEAGQTHNDAEARAAHSPAAEGVQGAEHEDPARDRITKSFGDIQSFANRLRTKWAKVKRENIA